MPACFDITRPEVFGDGFVFPEPDVAVSAYCDPSWNTVGWPPGNMDVAF